MASPDSQLHRVANENIRWRCNEPIIGDQLTYDSLDELRELGDKLPDVEEYAAYGHNDETGDWQRATYRSSWWTADPDTGDHILVGITSSNKNFFAPHQYGDVTTATADAVERYQDDHDYDFTVNGFIETSETYHKYLNEMAFDGVTINPGDEDDPIQLGLRVTTGNNGYQATRFDIGAERLVCSNGMTQFMAENSLDQTHQETFSPGLAHLAVESILDGVDAVEAKLEQAQQQRFMNKDEALLTLYDLGIPDYLEGGRGDIVLTYEEEVEDRNQPSQYELYQVATNLLSNKARDGIPQHRLQQGFDAAAQLLETGDGQLPDPDSLAEDLLERRAYELTEADADEYWDGEGEDLRQMLDVRGLTA